MTWLWCALEQLTTDPSAHDFPAEVPEKIKLYFQQIVLNGQCPRFIFTLVKKTFQRGQMPFCIRIQIRLGWDVIKKN
jgi:hypothetical protein